MVINPLHNAYVMKKRSQTMFIILFWWHSQIEGIGKGGGTKQHICPKKPTDILILQDLTLQKMI